MRVENENESSHKKLRVEIENEMRVFLESLNFEIETRVSQKSALAQATGTPSEHSADVREGCFIIELNIKS